MLRSILPLRASLVFAALIAALIAGPVAAQSYVYTAQLRGTASIQGKVIAAGLEWKCDGNACRISGPWEQPGVFACHSLAAKVGAVASYGRPGASLGPQQLAVCNQGLTPTVTPKLAAPFAPIVRPMPQAIGMAAAITPAQMRERSLQFNQLVNNRAQAVNRVQKPGQAPLLQPPIMMAASPAPKHMVILSQGDDCDDNNPGVHPGATEVCDGRDNNCDGIVDEGQTTTYFLDADGDGHGDPNRRVQACPYEQSAAASEGHWLVLVGNDCNDSNPDVWHDCRP